MNHNKKIKLVKKFEQMYSNVVVNITNIVPCQNLRDILTTSKVQKSRFCGI